MTQSLIHGSGRIASSEQSHSPSLFPSLSLVETWGFGLTGLLLWMGVAPATQAELGEQAMWVWIPGAIVGVIINLQVRALGQVFPQISGGTPNYVTHLLKNYRNLTSYAAIGYLVSWIAVLPVNAIILTDLIETVLKPLGIVLPAIVLKVGFTVLAFIVAFSGSHALGTLHLIFLLPAVGFLLMFCLQGSHAVTQLPVLESVQDGHSVFSIEGWAKWYLNGTYAFYACETASVFVADSKRPFGTLQSLLIAAGLIPVVYIGGSWVLLHLSTGLESSSGTYSSLIAAAQAFWGTSASFLVTFLVVSSSLLSCATAVAICPRILYQLAQDGYISPIFGTTSRQGVFTPGLLLTLFLSLVWLFWGDVQRIVMITCVGWIICFIVLHWGLWKQREQLAALFPRLSLALCGVEVFVLIIGGYGWGLQDLFIGLLLPIAILIVDRKMQRVAWKLEIPQWLRLYSRNPERQDVQNFIAFQVLVLILFICGATVVSWSISALVSRSTTELSMSLLVVLILVLSFIGIAIACWTVFPQIVAVDAARNQAEQLSLELQHTLKELQQTQLQMVQQEKLSSLGQLVAGVAHEINNPVNFIHGNLDHLQEYTQDLLGVVKLYEQHYPNPVQEIQIEAERIDLEYVKEDFEKALASMKLGTDRIRQIVLSLRNFSRMDEAEFKSVDLHEGIESTLMILQSRIKATLNRPAIEIMRDYAALPLVECYPGQLNQVIMNILVNAIDALDQDSTRSPQISIRTAVINEQWVQIAIADNGVGMPEAVKSRIFDPFFTTKPVGQGTGLGMSISYNIIVEKHYGKLDCFSKPDQGTEFVIQVPVRQSI
ncbi:amino acid permease [Cyanobacteria bacterium FACHB-63]|nr:amino acid permease [Cyanobacteria bacterium FACHB-63]